LGQFPESLFNYPLSDEVINRARGIIVHSQYMAGLVRGVRPDVPLSVVPMGVPLPPYIPKEEARARLGIDPDLFLMTSVGHLNPYKRVPATLRAFKALLMEVPNSCYLLVGSRSTNYDPTRQIEMLGLTGKVRTTGYASPQDFAYYLAASDVCLNLRYPTAGETSASLLRIMGAGVPVLVSRTGSFEELPDGAVGKVDVGDIEEDLLLEYLLLLARRSDLRTAMSQAARQYVAEHHTLEGAARGYLAAIEGAGVGGRGYERQRGAVGGREIEIKGSVKAIEYRAPSTEHRAPSSEQPQIQDPKSKIQSGSDPLSLVAQAAAELGIGEEDEAVLEHLARTFEGIV
ncbi:MAG: glycosyltransferase family 4 protein, partial [Chloroflexia bacterium]